MNYIAVALLSITPVLYGFYYSSRQTQTINQLDQIIKFIRVTLDYIVYQSSTVKTIIKNLSESGRFAELNIKFEDIDYNELARKITLDNKLLYIENKDKQSFYDFLNMLGTSNKEGQINHCEMYINHFTTRLYDSKESSLKKQKLYKSLGILGGLFVAVMFI